MRNTKKDYFIALCCILAALMCALANIRHGLNWTIVGALASALAGLSFCWTRMRKWRGTFFWAAIGTMWIVGGYLRSHPHVDPTGTILGASFVVAALLNAYHVLRQGSDLVRL